MPEVDVFVSWTRSDAGSGPRRLVDALRSLGISVWFDEDAISTFDPISASVRDGLERAKVLVAWYSIAYPTRRACREELTLALLAAERVGQGALRVLVLNPERGLEHVLESPLLDRRFASRLELADLPSIASKVADRLEDVVGPFGSLDRPRRPRWYGGEGWQGGSTRFVGRFDKLWKIQDQLQRTSSLVGPGRAGRAVALVSGPGGMGKSLLAAEYAEVFASSYPGGVFWLSAFGNDGIRASSSAEDTLSAADVAFMRVAGWLGIDLAQVPPETAREWVKTYLDTRGQQTLWIIDDLPTGLSGVQLDAWRCAASCVAELVTTRDRSHSRLYTIDLDVLGPDDALELITQGRYLDRDDRHQAELLAADLGYYPLACDVAGLYVASRTTFADFRKQIGESLAVFDGLAELLSDELPGGHAREITATLAASLTGLGEDAWMFLRIAAGLAPIAIPRVLLVAAFDEIAGEDANGFSRRAVDAAIGDQHRDGLWRFDPEGETVSIHVLVRRAAVLLDARPELQSQANEAVKAAISSLLANGARDGIRLSTLTIVAEHCRDYLAAFERLEEPTIGLADALAEFDFETGNYRTACPLFQAIYDACCRTLGAEHPETLRRANNLADVLRVAGDLEAASMLQRSTYDICNRVLGHDDPMTLASATNLAAALYCTGDLNGARRLLQMTYDAQYRILGRDHTNTLATANNLASTFQAIGDVDRARQLFQSVHKARSRILGPAHPKTLSTANNLASVLGDIGDLGEAYVLFKETHDACCGAFGPDHPHTLATANNLAGILRKRGDLDGALRLFQATHETRRRVLGDDHPDTLMGAGNLAGVLQAMGNLEQACELFQETHDTRRRVLGDDHPDTLAGVSNLANALRAIGNLGEARELCRLTYERQCRVLGPKHPDTLSSANNLAGMLRITGDLKSALQLFRATHDARSRVLGPEHPDTLTSSSDLAVALRSIGDLEGARQIGNQTYGARRRILGPEHPDTLLSANNLALALQATGDLEGARQLSKTTYDIRCRVLGPEHPETLRSADTLVCVMEARGDLEGALQLSKTTYDIRCRVLGPEHPDTLTSANNVAVLLREMGDLIGAHHLFQVTYDACCRVLGPEHPDTLTGANNLAMALQSIGDVESALQFFQMTYDACCRVLGPEHPDTVRCGRQFAAASRSTRDCDHKDAEG